MAINTKLKTDIAFKRLAGNASITNPDKSPLAEAIKSNIQASANMIFADDIPSSPGNPNPESSTYIGAGQQFNTASGGTVQLVQFDLVPIGASKYDADGTGFGSQTDGAFDEVDGPSPSATTHSFALRLPGNYTTDPGSNSAGVSQNPKAGTGFFVNNGYLTGSNGSVQIIPALYGSDYVPYIQNANGDTLDASSDSQDFYLDTFAGVLFRQDGDDSAAQVPKTLEAYIYIGKMVSESSVTPPLSDVLNVGNKAENDILLTGSLVVTSSAGAVDIVDFSGVNSVTASAFHVTQNADIDGDLNVDGNTKIDGTLTVDGDVTLGNAGSDTVTVTGDLIVQGNTTNIDTTNLVVEDPFILLNSSSGVPSMRDGGIIVQTRKVGTHTAHGTALFYDESRKAWGITGASGSAAAPGTVAHNDNDGVDAQVNIITVQVEGETPSAGGHTLPLIGDGDNKLGQMFVDTTDNEGGLYIYLPGNLG